MGFIADGSLPSLERVGKSDSGACRFDSLVLFDGVKPAHKKTIYVCAEESFFNTTLSA